MRPPPPHTHLRPHLASTVWEQRLRLTESDKLQVQIQAYLDNVFDVGTLLEDTETKNAVLEHMEELQEQVALLTERLRDAENDSMAKIAELEKQLSQARKELETLRVSLGVGWARLGVWAGPGFSRSLLRLDKSVHPRRGLGRGCCMPKSLWMDTDLFLGTRRSAAASRPPWALPDKSLSQRKCLPLPWCDDPQL